MMTAKEVVVRRHLASYRARRRDFLPELARETAIRLLGGRYRGVFAAVEYLHRLRVREIDREERRWMFLVALVTCAPLIVSLGRLLTE